MFCVFAHHAELLKSTHYFGFLRYFRYIVKSQYFEKSSVFKHLYVLKCCAYEPIITVYD